MGSRMARSPQQRRRQSKPDHRDTEPRVTIVGAGLAGMTAALRLLERGFHVTLIERERYLGGKLGAYEDPDLGGKGDFHEHSFHMYLNWYHNFWQIADEIGIIDNFVPQHALTYLKRREYPRIGMASQLTDVGAVQTAWKNLFSGVESPVNMYLYGYSLLDLLAAGGPIGNLDRASVSSFLESRCYFTEKVEVLHRHTLAKAFASPTYLNSARSYQQFIGYGFRRPSPMAWLLKGNTDRYLFRQFEDRLNDVARVNGVSFQVERSFRIDEILLDDEGQIKLIGTKGSREVDLDPKPQETRACVKEIAASESLILAVPFEALSRLISGRLLLAAIELGNVRKLRGQPMASIDIYFNRKLENVPQGITLLADSPFDLTFVDNSQLWKDGGPSDRTFLNLIISDFSIFTSHTEEEEKAVILESALAELRNYIEFDYAPPIPSGMFLPSTRVARKVEEARKDDVDRERCHIQYNVHEQLFVNEVGSWDFRPETSCRIPNLFIAGDYCKTFIDVVTIEGAVVSGLMAADAVQQRAGVDRPVEILRPETIPQPFLAALKWMGAPYAIAAKAASMWQSELQRNFRMMFPNG
jgi:hypothetical protein